MVDLYFTTVVRTAPHDRSGQLVRVDWETKRVVGTEPMFATNPDVQDPNPRGGARGGRGIAVVGDRVVAATYHSLRIFDRDLRPVRDLSHGLLVGVHELAPSREGRLWVACTGIDAALEVDLASGEVTDARWPRDDPALQARLQVSPLAIDKSADNRQVILSRPERSDHSHLHLNAVATWNDELYALCSHVQSIVNLDRGEVVVQHPALRNAHNLHIFEDGSAMTSGTVSHSLELWDLLGGASVRSIRVDRMPWVREHTRTHRRRYLARRITSRLGIAKPPTAHPLFIRGQHVDGCRVWVGLSPAAVILVDWHRGTLEDAYAYDDRTEVAIHGVAVAA